MESRNIVLLHGWGATTEKLAPLGEKLQKSGWKVVVLPLPGFDLPDPDFVWGMEDYAKYVLSKARGHFKDKKFFVFGHSFGGGVAMKLAVEQKEYVSGLILCATRGISRGSILKRYVFLVLAKSGKIFLVLPGVATFYKKILYKFAREHDYEKASSVMKEVLKKVVAEDLKPVANNIEIPTLILWGKLDKMTPVGDAYFLKKNVKKSETVLFEGVGHRLPYERPDDLVKEINKWEEKLQ